MRYQYSVFDVNIRACNLRKLVKIKESEILKIVKTVSTKRCRTTAPLKISILTRSLFYKKLNCQNNIYKADKYVKRRLQLKL